MSSLQRILLGSVVCSSGLSSKARGAVGDAVSSMGGKFVHDLSKSVTHLVVGTGGVASDKHKAAVKAGIKCVSEQWIWDCSSKMKYENCDNYEILYYLSGLVICVTGDNVSNEQRLGIANLVAQGGGRYEAAMEGGVCTHLIASEPSGRKWELAQSHPGTHVVSRRWLMDCTRLKARVAEEAYPVLPTAASAFFPSAAEQGATAQRLLAERPHLLANRNSACEALLQEFEALREMLQDSRSSDFPNCLGVETFRSHTFYFIGFPTNILDRLLAMVFIGGGRRHHLLTAEVTAVFVGEKVELDALEALRRHPTGAPCLKVAWLLHELKPVLSRLIDGAGSDFAGDKGRRRKRTHSDVDPPSEEYQSRHRSLIEASLMKDRDSESDTELLNIIAGINENR